MKKILLLTIGLLFAAVAFSQNFVESTYLGTLTSDEIKAKFGGLALITYDVDFLRISYTMPDLEGESAVVSGLLVIPKNTEQQFPWLCYQHGTSTSSSNVPSFINDTEEDDIAYLFGGLGYMTFAPDYLGHGISPGFHPYVHAESEANAGISMYTACLQYARENNIPTNDDQLFITGYSQGGHASMAMHKKLETEFQGQIPVTAAAHLSGPYSISGVMFDLILNEEPYGFPSYLPNTLLSYQDAYGNLWDDYSDIFKAPYINLINQFYTEQIDLIAFTTGLLTTLIVNEGASIPVRMLREDYIDAFMSDPDHPLNLALRDNDLFDWTPQRPTRLFYCQSDDQVPFENSTFTDSVFRANNAPFFASTDVNPAANHFQCVDPAITNTVSFFAFLRAITTVTNTTEQALSGVTLAPNPASSVLSVSALPANSNIRLMDAFGRIVLTQNNRQGSLDLAVDGFAKGLYYLVIDADGVVAQRKVVLN